MTGSRGSRPIVRGADEFDVALAVAARSLVVSEMPAAILDVPTTTTTRSRFPIAPLLAAGPAIVVLAITLFGWHGGAGSTRPVFRTASEISLDLRGFGYTCRPGDPSSPGHPRMEAIVCVATLRELESSVVISEGADGQVGELHATLSALGTSASTTLEDRVERLIGLPFAETEGTAAAVHRWLVGVLPLERGVAISAAIHGVHVAFERVPSGDYRIVVGDLGVGRTAEPPR